MKSHAATVGWPLLFASVTCLQWYIRWDLFVLRTQPLDRSPLGLWWHNKTLVPAKLPQYSVTVLEIPATFLGRLIAGTAEMVIYHLPCHQDASPWLLEDPTRCQWTAWSRGGIHPPSEWGWRPRMHNRTWWGAGASAWRGGEYCSSDW
jgi:hypothetical protein